MACGKNAERKRGTYNIPVKRADKKDKVELRSDLLNETGNWNRKRFRQEELSKAAFD